MSGVFISYRRDDSGGYAGRLFDLLAARLGERNVFMDLDGIRGGDDFPKVIEEKVSQCDVLLAVIGEHWLTITGRDGKPRLTATHDWVRLEIAKALERRVRVIPVLVGRARMPQQIDLPEDLRGLALRQAMDVRDAHFQDDAHRLIETIFTISPGVRQPQWKLGRHRLITVVGVGLALAMVGGVLSLVGHGTPTVEPETAQSVKREAVPPARISTGGDDRPGEQTKPGAVTPSRNPFKAAPVEAPTKIAGKWKAGVTYGAWEGVYPETFDFEVAGAELSGSAGFLSVDRGIFNGKVEGDRISFMTKSLVELGDKTYQDKHYYKGTLEGNTIRFTMNTDSEWSSDSPVHFTAKRVGEAEKVAK